MKFIIKGGHHLKGDVTISGMKNAATPIIAATLLTQEECIIKNVPRITDVEKMLGILQSLGAKASWDDEHTVRICCNNVDIRALDVKAVKSMRSSVLLIGPLLARFREAELPEPGGCILGNRSLDDHITALRMLGVTVEVHEGVYRFSAASLQGGLTYTNFSVTATENALMAAALTAQLTTIRLAASEPHVQDLCAILQKLGVDIQGIGTNTLTIRSTSPLRGAEHTLIPDQIEIGTFAVAAALTHGQLRIAPVVPEHLDVILLTLQRIGVPWSLHGNVLEVQHSSSALRAFRLQTLPSPGFPTDLQAPFGVLATQCTGTSLIHDPMYEGRMGYIAELIKMGANAIVADPHRVVVTGPTPLYGQEIKGLDIRAGATMVIAGLVAQGETVVHEAEKIDRGYERIEEKLRGLGADIQRVE